MMRSARDNIGLTKEQIGSLYGENPALCLGIKDRGKINFLDLFDDISKPYVIITFLSILDLSKKSEIIITQDKNFGEIYLEGSNI